MSRLPQTQKQKIEGFFSTWFLQDKGILSISSAYATEFKNGRIKNWVVTIRPWYSVIDTLTWWSTWIKGFWQYGSNILLSYNWSLYRSNDAVTSFANLWALNATSSATFLNIWSETYIYHWWTPEYYDGTNIVDVAWLIINPRFWAYFWGRQWVAWDATATNSIFYSRQYDITDLTAIRTFKDASVSPQDQFLWFDWVIEWLFTTQNLLYAFTNEWVYTFQNEYQVAGSNYMPVFKKIFPWVQLNNHNCVVSSWEQLFMLTKDRHIKTINFIAWVEFPQLWELSHKDWASIGGFMDWLDNDQSEAFIVYDRWANLVKFHLKSNWWSTIDTILLYDLETWQFIEDTNKPYWAGIFFNWKMYVWNHSTGALYIDEVWTSDNNWDIWWSDWFRRVSKKIDLHEFDQYVLRWIDVVGSINLWTTINMKIYLNDETTPELGVLIIDKNTVSNREYWTKSDNNKLYRFIRSLSKGTLNEKIFTITVEFTAIWKDFDFTLDKMAFEFDTNNWFQTPIVSKQ